MICGVCGSDRTYTYHKGDHILIYHCTACDHEWTTAVNPCRHPRLIKEMTPAYIPGTLMLVGYVQSGLCPDCGIAFASTLHRLSRVQWRFVILGHSLQ
jgi:hypothetical protein